MASIIAAISLLIAGTLSVITGVIWWTELDSPSIGTMYFCIGLLFIGIGSFFAARRLQ